MEKSVNNMEEPIGKALASFIISIIAVAFSSTGILCIPGLVLGIVALAFSRNSINVNKKPYTVFRRIAFPMSIAAIAVGALMATIFTGVIIYLALGGKFTNEAILIFA